MTPLVDVVMVILIFLMLAGSFAGAEHYLVSNVPFTDKGAAGARGRIFSLWHAAILTAAAVVSGAAGAVTAMAAIAHRVASVVPKI